MGKSIMATATMTQMIVAGTNAEFAAFQVLLDSRGATVVAPTMNGLQSRTDDPPNKKITLVYTPRTASAT